MGLFSKLKDQVHRDISPAGFFKDGSPIQKEQKEQAEEQVRRGKEAAGLKRAQFDILREDVAPLRSLRDENINRLLTLQGIGQPQDISAFNISPEFTTVRDAALQVQGLNPGQSQELAERANQLGFGEFGNFRDRTFGTAGFSSSGLANTNRLLQQNVDARANILNNAGALAASGLMSGAQQRGQAAGTAAGLLGSFLSDARLKKNIKQVGTYETGINKYTWDWTEQAKAIVGQQPSEGAMAHEVMLAQPENIEIIDGYLAIIDMGKVINGD